MGGGKSGSTGTQSSNQSSTVSIPPEVLARYNSVNAQAQDVSQTPFQPYTGEFVAPINEQQQYGINQITGAGNWINPTYNNQVNSISAGLASAQPQYNAASGNITAGLAGGQSANTQALGQYGAAVGQAQPYNTAAGGLYGAATGLANAGTQAVNPSQVNAQSIGQYMSPYNDAVVQATLAQLNQQQAQQRNAQTTQQILGGSFGGDRSGIDKAVLSGQQNLATASTVSGLENQNYAQALGAAQQQQGVGLGAAQANRAAIQQGAGQVAGIGQQVAGLGQQVYGQGTGQAAFTGQIGQQGYNQALGAAGAQQGLGTAEFGTLAAAGQGYGQAGGQALQSQLAQGQAALGAGTVEQQTQQAQDTAQYNQFLQQQAYPFQTTQFLANIAEGTGALSGSTTNAATNQYTPQPFFSDRRLKENIKTIGHSSAGIPIVRYNYKGSPHTQIGMIAQDVEKKRPDAVGLAAGYKTVDYDRATRAHGGLAGGGPATVIYHLGGTVTPEDAGRGFADGGAPGLDPVTMAQILAAQQAMYPGAAGRHGMGDGSGPRGVQAPQGGSHQLMKAELMKMPAQQQQTSGMQQGLRDVSAAATAGKDAKTLYGLGKEAYNGTGLGAASTNKPGAVTPSDVDSSGKYVDTLPTVSSVDPSLPDGTLVSDVLARGGRARRDVGGFIIPTLQEIGDVSGKQITRGLSGPTRPQTPLAMPTPGLAPPAPAPVTAPPPAVNDNAGSPMMTPAASMPAAGGSANGATGSGGDAAGGVSGTGGVGGSATDGSGGSAAAGTSGQGGDAGDDGGGGTYRHGGTIGRALRYAAGGMPYGDDAVGYVPEADFQPTDPAKLAKEQKDMEAPLSQMQKSGSGSGGDSTLGDIGQAVGIAAKVAPLLLALAGGGRANNVVPFPSALGGARRGYETDGGVWLDPDAPPGTAPVPTSLDLPKKPSDEERERIRDESKPNQRERAPGLGAAPSPTQAPPALVPTETPAAPPPTGGQGYGGPDPAGIPPQGAPPVVAKPMPKPGLVPNDDKKAAFVPTTPTGMPPQSGGVVTPTPPTATTPDPNAGLAGSARTQPDFFDKVGSGIGAAGDWLDRHERQIVPALSFLGSMLSSPSRTLAGAVGSGMVGGAQSLAQQQGIGQAQERIGQGQQQIDITKNAQIISLWQQARQMYNASITAEKPGGDPSLKAQMDRLSGMINMSGGAGMIGGGSGGGGAGGFDTAVNRTLGYEGGYNPRDSNGAPVNMGINGAFHPGVDIKNLTKDQARDIYKKQYWDAINGDKLDPKIQGMAFDTAVISGPEKSKEFIRASGGDPTKFMQLREQYEEGLARSDPAQYGRYRQTWANRRADLAKSANAPPALNQPTPIQTTQLPAPTTPTPPPVRPEAQPQQVTPDKLPPSMQVPVPKLTPEIEAQLPPEMQPTAMERAGNLKLQNGDAAGGNQLLTQARTLRQQYNTEGNANGIPLEGGPAFTVAKARAPENTNWLIKQGEAARGRQLTHQSVDEIVKQLQTFQPGAFAHLQHDLLSKTSAVGLKPPAGMDPKQYEIFVKNVASIVSSSAASSGDEHTDAARRLIADAFTGPEKTPGAVRDVLAKAKGQLDYSDEFLKYANPKINQEPRLDRAMLADEFNREHNPQSYVDKHTKNIAVLGDLPDLKSPETVDRAYMLTPQQFFSLLPTNTKATLDTVKKSNRFDGSDQPRRFRIKNVNGVMTPVRED